MSNFYEHYEAVVDFGTLVHNRVKGEYRQKKRREPEANFFPDKG